MASLIPLSIEIPTPGNPAYVIGDTWPDHTISEVQDSNGDALDLTGYTATAQVRTADGLDIDLTATIASSAVTLSFTPAMTAKFAATNTIQVQISDGTDTYTIGQGTVTAIENIV